MSVELSSLTYSTALKGRYVFLSASFPEPTRSPSYYLSTNTSELREAVLAAVSAIFATSGRLVFGGHPTISPLVLSLGREFTKTGRTRPLALVYQARPFESQIPHETRQLVDEGIAEIRFKDTLDEMRVAMLKETDPAAGIFIGGMEGIEDEFTKFVELLPGRPAYCLGVPGGAARILAKRIVDQRVSIAWQYRDIRPEALAESHRYNALAQDIVSDVAWRLS